MTTVLHGSGHSGRITGACDSAVPVTILSLGLSFFPASEFPFMLNLLGVD